MGMTEELPVARLFRRLTVIEHELGSADAHRMRYARMAALAA
jgi:alkylation response protein AidB-like acyl-CoA dehydrogenase